MAMFELHLIRHDGTKEVKRFDTKTSSGVGMLDEAWAYAASFHPEYKAVEKMTNLQHVAKMRDN